MMKKHSGIIVYNVNNAQDFTTDKLIYFKTRYKEHIKNIKYNSENSKYAKHITDKQYTMEIIRLMRRGRLTLRWPTEYMNTAK